MYWRQSFKKMPFINVGSQIIFTNLSMSGSDAQKVNQENLVSQFQYNIWIMVFNWRSEREKKNLTFVCLRYRMNLTATGKNTGNKEQLKQLGDLYFLHSCVNSLIYTMIFIHLYLTHCNTTKWETCWPMPSSGRRHMTNTTVCVHHLNEWLIINGFLWKTSD